jgi:hypothetical protein
MSVWDAINNAVEPSKHFFGLNTIDVWPCALVKGQGKVPFDDAVHANSQKRHAINICITPLPSSGLTYNTERETIAESADWAKYVLPSIHLLGLTPEQINNRYVQVELVKSGTYTKNGEVKDLTMPRYVAVYNSEAECEAAANAMFGKSSPATPAAAPAPAPTNGITRETALKFLPGLLASAGGDLDKASAILSTHNLLKDHFTINSPEVVDILAAQVMG